ncbi:DUF6507 family protein [Microbacterium sp. 179-I 3D4 NHS]|uniref:DUF6507 family protein n=1 Tax=Microbacterium sp. 179-I 3D4 NHS TaxID=3142381 RepID=UPI0039A364A4
MDEWSVDTAGVLGVLAGVDSAGADFESAHEKIVEAAESGAALSVDGRRTLSDAWAAFLELRSLVPGKVMHVAASAAASLGEASAAVVAGDDQMAADSDAARRAAEEWGIGSPEAYGSIVGAW